MIDESANRWLRAANAIKTKIEPPRQAIIPEERASKLETRAHSLDAELRAEMSGDKLKLTGYAAVFNSRSEDLGGFTEVIAPGAFRKSLQSRNDIKLLWNHDTSSPLASTRAGTLRLIEDAKGLRVEADLAPTTLGKDISILVQRGDVSAFSFGFNVIKDSWSNSGTERTLEAVRLFEASLVSFPAYSATSGTATVRALDVDQLAAGLLALENGDNLEPDVARVLKSTIDKLVIQPDAPADDGLIALKKKKLDLMLMEAE
jgi:HK97 family phage prohead protease